MTLVVPMRQQEDARDLAPYGICFQLFAISQRLKPESIVATYGTTKVVPCYRAGTTLSFFAACKAATFKAMFPSTASTPPYFALAAAGCPPVVLFAFSISGPFSAFRASLPCGPSGS